MKPDRQCMQCGTAVPSPSNFCSWKCHVEHTRARGGRDHRPNGLPVGCITAAGLLTECGHGDHETYLFPVDVDGQDDPPPEPREYPQMHALIYTDGCCALTLYDCTYVLWLLCDGAPIGGRHYREHERLSEKARADIAAYWTWLTSTVRPDVDAIRARAATATPGPWTTSSEHSVRAGDDELVATTTAYERHAADAEFIAHARSDIPALLAQVARLRDALETLSDRLEGDGAVAQAALNPVGDPDGKRSR